MPTEAEIAAQRVAWHSMKHVGAYKPTLRAFVRKGHLERHYQRLPSREVYSYVPGLNSPNTVWFGEWVPDTEYMEVPNILEAKGDTDFTKKGVETLTMTIDNVVMTEQVGLAGIFHAIERGYMAPLRGDDPASGAQRVGTANAWNEIWKSKAAQIMIVGGYGGTIFPVFLGLVDDADLTSQPDRITITARNMGQVLTDQRAFMDAKNLWLRDPITFADRLYAQKYSNVADNAQAKSHHGGHPARLAVDDDDTTKWLSDGYADRNSQDWFEVTVPGGRFLQFGVNPAYDGMEVYVSVHTSNDNVPGNATIATFGGNNVAEGWINNGSGNVPGTTIPFINRIPNVATKLVKYPLDKNARKIISGDNTRVRLWFRNLHAAPTDNGKATVFRAGAREIEVYDTTIEEEAKKKKWILVDDAANVVKTVLQWCGFTDWEVESTGVRLKDKIVFDRQTFLMDIIWKIAEMTSYVFYVKPPEDFDIDNLSPGNPANKSMGIPVFRQNSAMKQTPPDSVERIYDTQLLTGIQAKFDTTPLANSIRARGKEVAAKKAKGDPEHIHPLGADRTKRYQYSYRPVWARADDSFQAGIRRVTLHYDQLISSVFEAKVACLLIAFRQALESAKAEVQCPFFPAIQLDHQSSIFDTGTGLSTRLYIVQRGWRFHGGAKADFSMTVGGSLIDVPDVAETRTELELLLNDHGYMPQPIARGPWEDVHTF